MDAWHVQLGHTRRPFDRSALYFCGFPTLQHIKHKVCVPMFGLEGTRSAAKVQRTELRSKESEAPALAMMRSAYWPNIIKAFDVYSGPFFLTPFFLVL